MKREILLCFGLLGLFSYTYSQNLLVNPNFDVEKLGNINIDDVTWTLEYWGDKSDRDIDYRFKIACKLEEVGNYKNAIDTYLSMLALCIERKESLHIDQFDNVLLRMAYCYADMNNQREALSYYNYRLDVLKDVNEWRSKLPSGLIIIRDKSQDTIDILMGLCYQDRAITYSQTDKYKEGLADLVVSDRLLRDKIADGNDYANKILDGYFGFINNCYLLKKLEIVLESTKVFQIAASEIGKPFSAEKIITILRYARNSAAILKKYDISREYSKSIIDIVNQSKYKDDFIKDDQNLDDYLKTLK